MDVPIVTLKCPNCGNIFNIKLRGNTFNCDFCGAINVIKREYIINPEDEVERIIEELLRRGIIDNKDEVNKQTQNATLKTSEPRKKSVAGRIWLTIGIIYTIFGLICSLVNVIAENTNEGTGPSETTLTTTEIGTPYDDYGYGSDPAVPSLPPPRETTEFVPNKVLLVNMTPYTDMPYIETTYVSDIFDNDYRNGIYSRIEETDGECSCTYRIYQKYDKLTFTSGIVEFGRGDPGEAIIRIYGDGVQIYERYLDCTSDSIFEDINVSGVNDLTLELYGYSEPEVSLRGSTALYPCIWEPTLYTTR